MNIDGLRAQHSAIIKRAAILRGQCDRIRTSTDAEEARAAIDGLDTTLVAHLRVEDETLYPALRAATDPEVQAIGAAASEDMGGLLGAWVHFRDHWTTQRIAASPAPFGTACGAIIDALHHRISAEEDVLYPTAARLTHRA